MFVCCSPVCVSWKTISWQTAKRNRVNIGCFGRTTVWRMMAEIITEDLAIVDPGFLHGLKKS